MGASAVGKARDGCEQRLTAAYGRTGVVESDDIFPDRLIERPYHRASATSSNVNQLMFTTDDPSSIVTTATE